MLATTLVNLAGVSAVVAQDAAPQLSSETRTFNIKPQALANALTQFGGQAGIQVSVNAASVSGLTSPGVSGSMTPQDAIRRLLAGTNLSHRFTGPATVLIGNDAASTGATGGADETVLEEIVVNAGSGGVIQADGYVGKSSATGAKVDTPFVQTPQSISSVTQSQINDRNPQSLSDAIAYTPNVRVGGYGLDPRYDSFFVRGFNVTNTGVFRDNLRQPVAGYGIFLTEPYGIEGISILRGPSSALYGATGAGGLYNVITKRPTEEEFREVMMQVGTDDRYQAQFDASGPVSDEDQVYYRLTGLGRLSNTEIPAVPDDRAYIAPALTWQPDEGTRLTLLGEYSRSKSGGNPAYYNDYYGHVSEYPNGDSAFNDIVHQQSRFGWEFEHALDETFTFRQNARYSWQDIDAQYVYAYNGPQHALDPTLIDRGSGYDVQRLDSFVIDNQLQATFSTGVVDHTVLGGIDFTWAKYRGSSGGGTVDPLDTLNLNYGRYIATPELTSRSDQKQLQTGIYLQDQLRYDAWTVTMGGRYDWVNTDTTTTDLTTGAASSADQDDREFSGRIGVTYETSFGIVPYASYSTAFSPNIGINTSTNQPFKPTTSTQQEIGVKYLLPNANAMLTAALFNIDQDNGIFYEASATGTVPVQRGKLRSRGAELEATASLDNGLSFTAAYSYTELKILRGPAETIGNYVSSVPQHSAALWANYTFDENSSAYGFGVGAGARFIGSSYGDDTNTLRNGSRTFFDASLSYDFAALDKEYAGLKLQVNATNLFDRTDTTCTSGYCYHDAGRSVIGTLRYSW
ncbi:TonB-dependent siderophore receptor (plasmid) [Sinorhizobium sp. BG8]|nr:TonB-dependent siderophore receptor [Sinorhizobium sp. BG8]